MYFWKRVWKYVCKDQHFWNLVHKKYIVPVCVDRKFETKLKENKKDIINEGRSNCQQLSLSIVVSFHLLINFQLSPTQSSLVTKKMGKVCIFESLWTLGVLVWKFCCMVWKIEIVTTTVLEIISLDVSMKCFGTCNFFLPNMNLLFFGFYKMAILALKKSWKSWVSVFQNCGNPKSLSKAKEYKW